MHFLILSYLVNYSSALHTLAQSPASYRTVSYALWKKFLFSLFLFSHCQHPTSLPDTVYYSLPASDSALSFMLCSRRLLFTESGTVPLVHSRLQGLACTLSPGFPGFQQVPFILLSHFIFCCSSTRTSILLFPQH